MNKNSRIINKCIFCLTDDNLTDEHALPYSLNGNIVLNRATCTRCQRIIDKIFEHEINSDFYKSPRSYLKLHSRSKNYLKSLRVKKDGVESDFDIHKFGTVIDFPIIDTNTPEICKNVFSVHLRNEGAKLEPGDYEFKTTFRYLAFVRYLVKIAYCFNIFTYGLDAFDSEVVDFILGKIDKSPTVLTFNYDLKALPTNVKIPKTEKVTIHKVEHKINFDKNLDLYIISFFDFLNGPKYLVELKHTNKLSLTSYM